MESVFCFTLQQPYLGEQLEEAQGLPVWLGQEGDVAASLAAAAEKHAAAAEAPHGVAARAGAARLPTRRPASPNRQRVPTETNDAAPVDPEHATGHPAEIRRHTLMGTDGRTK